MCVCAGGTGAAIVPVTKAVRHQTARQAVPRRVAPAPLAVAAVPCIPVFAGDALAPDLGGLASLSPLPGLEREAFGAPSGSALGTLGGVGDVLASTSGVLSGGGGAGGGGGGASGSPGGSLPPVASNAPEPTSWVLMIGGFGLLGGAMRYYRRRAAV